ncbi:MAG: DUF5710 domain-containing protein [Methylococcaceae bacterium]|jgi:hypothetical protein
MTNTPIYLNVPYKDKDAAKALGARWDALNKKWYINADKDISLFGRWLSEATAPAQAMNHTAKTKPVANPQNAKLITYSSDKNFVAYSGDAPPWD